MAIKRSKEYFDKLWEIVIKPEMESLIREHTPTLYCKDESRARQDIWNAYCAFNLHASENYMEDPLKPLDRHKVAACYAFACLAARPLSISPEAPSGSRTGRANEVLAVTVACSVMAGFLDKAFASMEQNNLCDDADLIARSRERLDRGFPIDGYIVGYGTYLDSVLSCLFFMAKEEWYSILAFSLILYHWEQTLLEPEMQKCLAKLIRLIKLGEIDNAFDGSD